MQKEKRRGNWLGIWFFKTLIRLTGLRGAYALLYFVCLHYAVFDRAAVRLALPYILRRFPNKNRFQRWWTAYLLFVAQGKNLIDRHVLIAGAVDFDTTIVGYDAVVKLSEKKQGFILLTSHVGNWQSAMHSLEKLEKTVHLLMRPEDNPAIQSAVKVDAEASRIKIISPDQAFGGTVEVMKALEEGDLVSIMGDRTYGSDSVEVTFLGDTARFPYSAFHIAASEGCPIVILLSSKTGTTSYSVDMAAILNPTRLRGKDRKEQLRSEVQAYARILEKYLLAHPLQYFIFHDIWTKIED
jgi:predicted LPLAT superfamily acyltransferase